MKKFLMFIVSAFVLITSTVCLAACSGNAEKYSVSCGICENGYVTVADTNVASGEKVILAAHPDAGYMLSNYLLNGEVIDGCSFVMPEKDVTVSATFEIITYSITYVLGDAVVTGNNPDTYTVESADKLQDPEIEGYEVCGWYTYCIEPEYSWDWNIEDFRVTTLEGQVGNLTLYAKYYNLQHNVSYGEIENGDCYLEDYSFEARYGDLLNIIVDPYIGYELDYITVNGDKIEGTSFIMPAADIEIVAYFKLISYKITYVIDDDTTTIDYYTIKSGEGDYLEFPEPEEKEGYMFCGWCLDEERTNFIIGINVYQCSDITLYANFVADSYK